MQMLGRTGRDGLPSDLFFIGHHGADIYHPTSTGNPLTDAQHALNAIQSCQCHFTMMSMDGPNLGAYECKYPLDTTHDQVQPCSNCAPTKIHCLAAVLAVLAATQAHLHLLQHHAHPATSVTAPL